jgi:hypothetical protein
LRILVRTSKWAIWARRLGSFALPLAVIPVFLHRARLIESDVFELVEAVAVGFALLGLFLAFGAFVRLWVTGDRGWGKAMLGAVFSLVCLAPVGYGITLALRYPPVTDVSTDLADPPLLISGFRPPPAAEGAGLVRAAFPNVLARTYPLGTDQVFALANGLVQARGWDVRVRRAPQSSGEGQINAVAVSLLGWRDEISIRVRGTAVGGSVVSMRSASLGARYDLGSNGSRIEEFLLALDAEVTVMLRDAPAAAAPAAEPAPG